MSSIFKGFNDMLEKVENALEQAGRYFVFYYVKAYFMTAMIVEIFILLGLSLYYLYFGEEFNNPLIIFINIITTPIYNVIVFIVLGLFRFYSRKIIYSIQLGKILGMITGFLVYLIKSYVWITVLFIIIPFVFQCFCYNIGKDSPYSSPDFVAMMAAIFLPTYNILVFIILCWYRFNKLETICESGLFLYLLYSFSETYIPFQITYITTGIMLIYIVLKHYVIKRLQNR